MNRFCLALGLMLPGLAFAQKAALPEPSEKLCYKQVGDLKLEIWMWKPVDWKASDKRAGIVFYHGGGWHGGSPTAFARQSAKLAETGRVAFSVRYRLTSEPGVTIEHCIQDAKSAFRWVRSHAAELGVDPEKIAAGGGSAGGHLAAALTTLDAINDPAEGNALACRPAALLLFNPAANLDFERARERGISREELIRISPYHQLKSGHPPTVVFHGDQDTTVPIASVQVYVDKIKELGGEAEMVVAEGQGHGFFNKEPHVWDTLRKAEAFLTRLGL